jgi:crossover junction endodeoxyribonuclease RusA
MRLHKLPDGTTAARYPPAVYEWRRQVQQAIAEADEKPFEGAIDLALGFDLVRPRGHYGSGKNSKLVKLSSPPHPIVAPDLDKLVRCVGDAITDAGAWGDDAQVVALHAAKRYVDHHPGVRIVITEVS